MRTAACLLGPALVVLACHPPRDGENSGDGAPCDAPLRLDASLSDAVPADAAGVADADRPDSTALDASLPDADPCEVCVPSSDCLAATCTDGVCSESPLPDGTTCGPDTTTLCVAGACVTRGCGDGYREPGPVPAREGCDDGNLLAGDACSATCEPTLLVIAARPGETDVPTGGAAPSMAADDAGHVLAVWKASEPSGASIQIRELTRGGTPVGPATTLVAGVSTSDYVRPTVLGLAEGWVVAWTSLVVDGDSAGVAYQLVSPGGALGPVLQANVETVLTQQQAALARLGDGFVIAWADLSQASFGEGNRIRARIFGEDGWPTSVSEIEVSPESMREQTFPTVAARPDGFLIAWMSMTESLSPPLTVKARRFDALGVPLDAVPFVVPDQAADGTPDWSYGPSAATLETGDYVIAWTSREEDYDGDIRARVVPAAGPIVPGTSTPIATTLDVPEVSPSVASLGGAGYVVLVHEGSSIHEDIEVVPVDGTLAPERDALATLLTTGWRQETGSVLRVDGGLWFSWSDDGVVSGVPRAFVAYLLALD